MTAQALTHLFQEDLYSFQSQVVVILRREWNSYNDEEHILLKKIIASVRVDFNSVQIVKQSVVDLHALRIYAPSRILIFGARLPDNIPSYEPASAQGFTVIWADDLNELDEQKKKNFWLGLRQMFGV